MLTEKIKYRTFDDVEIEEELQFNLTSTELQDLFYKSNEHDTIRGYSSYLKKIVATKNEREMYFLMKDIVDMSYGIKSEDGRRFVKSKEILDEFKSTNAYSEFCTKLSRDSDYAAVFMKGVIPAEIREEAEKIQKEEQRQNLNRVAN